MKIVLLTNKLINGGGERVLQHIVKAVVKAKGSISIIFLGRKACIDPMIVAEMEREGARVVFPNNFMLIFRLLRTATTIHLYNLNVYVKALPFLPLLKNCLIISHVHGAAGSANKFVRMAFCSKWNPSDYIVFVSSAGKASYDIKRGIIVSNPVEFPLIKENNKSVDGDHLRMISVNRLAPIKRVSTQIRILHKLRRDQGIDATLDVVGGGDEYQSLLELTNKLGLNPYVHFLGGVDHREVLDLIGSYDLLIATSAHEGLGISLIEALGAGIPVVASEIPAFKEVENIGGGVLFIDPELEELSAKRIAEAIREEKLQTANVELIRNSFRSEKFADKIMGLYK